jgi:hypothetical protein
VAAPAIPTETVANDLREVLQGKVADDKLEAAVAKVQAADTSYAAHGAVASLIFWVKVQVVIDDGKTFDGEAWGIAFPGGGALFGDVYTDDLNAFFRPDRSPRWRGASAARAAGRRSKATSRHTMPNGSDSGGRSSPLIRKSQARAL